MNLIRLLELAGVAKGPTIVSATKSDGEIDRHQADMMVDPKGYFERNKKTMKEDGWNDHENVADSAAADAVQNFSPDEFFDSDAFQDIDGESVSHRALMSALEYYLKKFIEYHYIGSGDAYNDNLADAAKSVYPQVHQALERRGYQIMEESEPVEEGDVVPFPGNDRPTNAMAVARGGAEIRGFPEHVPLDKFARAYVGTALWSSHDDSDESGGEPLDANYDESDIAAPTLKKMAADCADFRASNAELLDQAYQHGYDEGNAGHDFWLTRNHHGAGFWDRGLGQVGRALTDSAHAYGGVDLYVGDDGMIHQ